MHRDRRTVLLFPLSFIVRRVIFIVAVIFVPQIAFKVFIFNISSLLMLIYLILSKPFKSTKLHYFELFNEGVLLLQTYVILSFSVDDTTKQSFDLIFISVCGVYLAAHLGNLFISLAKDIFKSCRKCYRE